MSEILFLAIGVFLGLALAVLVPDLAVIPAGWLRKLWDGIKRRTPKE